MSARPYVCRCGAKGVKLWREFQTFADVTDLYCVDCAGKAQKRDVSAVDLFGRIHDKTIGQPCDQIGGLVPAVPDGDGSFWGYTSVPTERVEWWRGLPNRESDEVMTRDAIAKRAADGAWPQDREALLFLLDEAMKSAAKYERAFMGQVESNVRMRERQTQLCTRDGHAFGDRDERTGWRACKRCDHEEAPVSAFSTKPGDPF